LSFKKGKKDILYKRKFRYKEYMEKLDLDL